MKIKSVQLCNFRNYKSLNLETNKDCNVFLGKNAQGKTNLLESIFFGALGKSFRSIKDKDIIKWGENNCKIKLLVEKKYRNLEICIYFIDGNKKIININGIPIKRTSELLGELPIVFFSPNELKLVKESPEERRKFMNIDISQTNKRYFYLLNRYDKILMNRNKLLKNSKNINELKDCIDIWDRVLVEVAEKIYNERKNFVREITPYAEKALFYLSEGKEKLKLEYKSLDCGKSTYADVLRKNLEKNLEKDYKLGYTSVGPHRDDIDIYINDIEVKNFGSQGQQRTVALSLKLAELEIIKEKTGDYPILLLDDVFSELDSDRRKRLLKFVSRTQTFITCTDFSYNMENCQIFNINNGQILNND